MFHFRISKEFDFLLLSKLMHRNRHTAKIKDNNAKQK